MDEVIALAADASGAPIRELHLLPCQIDYDGEAAINSFFIVKPEAQVAQTNQVTYQSTFRGRGLRGVEVKPPSRYEGAIYRESRPPPDIKEERYLSLSGSFNSLTTWGHSELPTPFSNNFLKAMTWLDVTEDLHAHVELG
ncbi:hypothetical protein SpCBS45565_g03250 [Spizellomyces sp. 'palustris']|nr:hypothetical protein SpCBS45565_g03250 [Spizellomyces sp. 'palustris']